MVGDLDVVGEAGMDRSMGLYSTSSGAREFLSVEKGVFSSGNGRRWSRCLEIRLRRCCVEVGASFSDLRRGVPRGFQWDWSLGRRGIGLLVNSRGKTGWEGSGIAADADRREEESRGGQRLAVEEVCRGR
jgi:hypothetical protein